MVGPKVTTCVTQTPLYTADIGGLEMTVLNLEMYFEFIIPYSAPSVSASVVVVLTHCLQLVTTRQWLNGYWS